MDSTLGEHKHRIQTSGETTANHQTRHFSCGQNPTHLRLHSTRRKMTMIYFKRRVSSFAGSLKSLSPSSRKATPNLQIPHFSCGQNPPHLWSHSTRRKMTMIYFKRRVSSFADSLKSLFPSFRKATPNLQIPHFSCGQNPTHLRSHSTRRKMTMIYFKRRVSSLADLLKSLYSMSPVDYKMRSMAS